MKRTLIIFTTAILIVAVFMIMVSCDSEPDKSSATDKPIESVTEAPDVQATEVPPAETVKPKQISALSGIIGCGTYHTIGLASDGTVMFTFNNEITDQGKWIGLTDITSVTGGLYSSFGLNSSGKVNVTGSSMEQYSAVTEWMNIVMIDAGDLAVAGVDSNGNGHAVSALYYDIETKINSWDNLQSIDVSDTHILGLKTNGRVVGAKSEESFNSDIGTAIDMDDWMNIIQVEAGQYFSAGLKNDGTLVVKGDYNMYINSRSIVDLQEIVMISAGAGHLVGLRSDGRVVAVGDDSNGQCDVGSWTDMISVAAGFDYTIGLKSDGTVLVAGDKENGECDVRSWILKNK